MPAPNLPAPTVQNPYGPMFTFAQGEVAPPAAVYVTPTDQIQIWIRNPSVSATIHLHYRLVNPDGMVTVNKLSFSCQSTGTSAFIKTIPPSEGFLLSLVIFAPAISRGQVYARVFLVPGSNSDEQVLAHMLVQGYVSDDDRLAFPTSPSESSLSGRGWLHTILFSNPAPGANFSTAVPAGVHWLLRAVFFELATDNNAGNRVMTVNLVDGSGNVLGEFPAPATVPASNSAKYSLAPGCNALNVSGAQSAGLPMDLILPPGFQVAFVGVSGAGDQISFPQLTVEEYVGQ